MKLKDYWDYWAKTYSYGMDMPLFAKWNIDHILDGIDLKNNPTIVDLGTGTGKLILEIGKINPNCRFVGVDISKNMLKKARINIKKQGLNAEFLENHLTKIILGDEIADFVVSNAVLHHIKNKEKLFSEIYRILKKKGKLAFSDSFDKPDKEFEEYTKKWGQDDTKFSKKFKESFEQGWGNVPADIKNKHPREFHTTFDELRQVLKKAGFKKIKIIPSPAYFAVVVAQK
jgi:ubiquinone/menaquinone biosynthesis C-methylase UbiE